MPANNVCIFGLFRRDVDALRAENMVLVISVGKSALRTPDGGKTAHAVLIQPFSDGVIRAFPADIDVPKPRRPRAQRKVS